MGKEKIWFLPRHVRRPGKEKGACLEGKGRFLEPIGWMDPKTIKARGAFVYLSCSP
jgi:hypothetical protein